MIKQYFLLFIVLISSSVFTKNFDIDTFFSIDLHRNTNLDPTFKNIANSCAVGQKKK